MDHGPGLQDLPMNHDPPAFLEILGAFAFCTDRVAEEIENEIRPARQAQVRQAANPELALVFQVIRDDVGTRRDWRSCCGDDPSATHLMWIRRSSP